MEFFNILGVAMKEWIIKGLVMALLAVVVSFLTIQFTKEVKLDNEWAKETLKDMPAGVFIADNKNIYLLNDKEQLVAVPYQIIQQNELTQAGADTTKAEE